VCAWGSSVPNSGQELERPILVSKARPILVSKARPRVVGMSNSFGGLCKMFRGEKPFLELSAPDCTQLTSAFCRLHCETTFFAATKILSFSPFWPILPATVSNVVSLQDD
jgi:hypothetical protein